MAGFTVDSNTKMLLKFENSNNPWKDETGNTSWNVLNAWNPPIFKENFNPYSNIKSAAYFTGKDSSKRYTALYSLSTLDCLDYNDDFTLEGFAHIRELEGSSASKSKTASHYIYFMQNKTSDNTVYGRACSFGLRRIYSTDTTKCYNIGRFYGVQDKGQDIPASATAKAASTFYNYPWGKTFHFAITHYKASTNTKASNAFYFYANGRYIGSNTADMPALTYENKNYLYIGVCMTYKKLSSFTSSSSTTSLESWFTGYLSNLRISNSVRYSPTEHANYNPDKLLNNFTTYGENNESLLTFDNGINDKKGISWTLVGNDYTIEDSNLYSGKMIHITGIGTYLYTNNFRLGGHDFTIDGWVNVQNNGFHIASLYYSDYSHINIQVSNDSICVYTDHGSMYDGTGDSNADLYKLCHSLTSAAGPLKHFAVVYRHDLKKMRIFGNGKRPTTYNEVSFPIGIDATTYNRLSIGSNVTPIGNLNFYGNPDIYIDQFRITNEALWWDADFDIEELIPKPSYETVNFDNYSNRYVNRTVTMNNNPNRVVYDDQYLRDKRKRAYEYR